MDGGIIEKLDRLVSELVRRRHADHAGFVSCYTCGESFPWQEMDAGHFRRRGHNATRFDWKRNVRPQCPGCNRNGGQEEEFAERLEYELGEVVFGSLIADSNSIFHFTPEYFSEVESEVKKELSRL